MLELTYTRLTNLLRTLLNANQPISAQQLSRKLHVSERTLRLDIKNLNEVLIYEPIEVRQKRKEGYFLEPQNEAIIDQLRQRLQTKHIQQQQLESTSDRINYLLTLFLTTDQYLTAETILDILYISKNTFYNYLKVIKDILEKFDLVLVNKVNLGFHVIGAELDKRNCFIDNLIQRNHDTYVMDFSENERQLFKNVELDILYKDGSAFLTTIFVDISDYAVKNILLHTALTISRIKQHQVIETFSFDVPLTAEQITQLAAFFDQIAALNGISLPEAEKSYLYYHVVLNDPQLLNQNESQNDSVISAFVQDFLEQIYQTYRIDLRKDHQLNENLAKHIHSLFQLLEMKAERENPLLEVIQTTFALAYEITLTTINNLPQIHRTHFSKDEVAYLALHVGAALERNYSNQTHKRKVVIVCGSGNATSMILEAKLSSLFNDTLEIIGHYSFFEYQQGRLPNCDFIISTLPLSSSDIPTVHIDLHNFYQDCQKLTEMIHTAHHNKQSFWNLFDDSVIFLQKDLKNKHAVIDVLSQTLVVKGIVNSQFADSIWEREQLSPSTLGNGLAIPHPMTLTTVAQSRVAIMSLTEPIDWGNNQQVDFIFLLALTQADYAKVQKLFDFLAFLQEDTKYKALFLKCHKPQELIQLLHSFGNNENEKNIGLYF